jgi:hypothetical protein
MQKILDVYIGINVNQNAPVLHLQPQKDSRKAKARGRNITNGRLASFIFICHCKSKQHREREIGEEGMHSREVDMLVPENIYIYIPIVPLQ